MNATPQSIPEPIAAQDDGLIELTHPGEMLREDFLEPMGLNVSQLSQAVGVPQAALPDLVQGKSSVSAETSLLLDRFFGLSGGYWLRLQMDYALRRTRRVLAARLSAVRPHARPREAAA